VGVEHQELSRQRPARVQIGRVRLEALVVAQDLQVEGRG
jgi:hypothetical protein